MSVLAFAEAMPGIYSQIIWQYIKHLLIYVTSNLSAQTTKIGQMTKVYSAKRLDFGMECKEGKNLGFG